jgi:DNA polymerase-3 subunit alpha
MEGNYEAARAAAGNLRDIFGKDNFYLEIQDQGLAKEHEIHPGLFQLEKDLGLPLVATNDSHYSVRRRRARAGCDAVHSDRKVDS